jgi:hypothetical protein
VLLEFGFGLAHGLGEVPGFWLAGLGGYFGFTHTI